ncbi:MAG TPA: tRNA pseudouridine(38-40) synthase TruA [Acetobacteraceae bacterium]|nr:tRNA pseudouridine(38-40) synthase TruA [Acetobacteraceae bacterium]
MSFWALKLEYDGTPFVGWQRQDNGISVQQVLEEAASRLFGGIVPEVVVAGRTDAGVHASAQFARMKLPESHAERYSAYQMLAGLNFHMKPHPVVVVRAAPAPLGWNPRFSALRRSYRYLILNRPARPVLAADRVWHVKKPLDAEAMHRAAQSLTGRHDFTSFRAAACQAKSPLRTLDLLSVRREGELLAIEAEARSFLHHQVRNMVGTLKLVGDGSWPESRVAAALAARDRAAAGPTAPPEGLTLAGIHYDPDPFETFAG